MRTLWEAIQDSDEKIDAKAEQTLFYSYFAKCFVDVFGKIDRSYAESYRLGRLGVIDVKNKNWQFHNWRTNQFFLKIAEMNRLLKKRYPDIEYAVESHDQQKMAVNPDQWLVKYLLSWRFDDDDENGVDWTIHVSYVKDPAGRGKINYVMPHKLSEFALKHKDLLKIIEDNI